MVFESSRVEYYSRVTQDVTAGTKQWNEAKRSKIPVSFRI
jgi:hypothetical protein